MTDDTKANPEAQAEQRAREVIGDLLGGKVKSLQTIRDLKDACGRAERDQAVGKGAWR